MCVDDLLNAKAAAWDGGVRGKGGFESHAANAKCEFRNFEVSRFALHPQLKLLRELPCFYTEAGKLSREVKGFPVCAGQFGGKGSRCEFEIGFHAPVFESLDRGWAGGLQTEVQWCRQGQGVFHRH